MSTFPGSPRLLKGALVTLDPKRPQGTVIAFQYNPESLRRSLSVSATQPSYGEPADPRAPLRLSGPPRESIYVEAELDALDQDGPNLASTLGLGLHPVLAAIELLLYPKAAEVIANEALLNLGTLDVLDPEMPLTLFVWGSRRVLPVRLSAFEINEQSFDAALNPIHAKVSFSMQVLTYRDLGMASPGGSIFMAHHLLKEFLATMRQPGLGIGDLLPGGNILPRIGG